MEYFLSFVKKLIPSSLFRVLQGPYHYALAFLAHVLYGMPSRKMYVIGVTGTKGKTTTCHLMTQLLELLGKNVGMTSSVQFRFGGKGKLGMRVNDTKQGMPGRFRLQKLLREMAKNGCEYAVIETTSEGMLQYRHQFIDYDMAVFTNLSPEHIERHGGFLKYRDTKVGLFRKVARKKNGIGVYNLDDENVEHFLTPNVAKKIGFSLQDSRLKIKDSGVGATYLVSHVVLTDAWSEFDVNDVCFKIPLIGEFNVYNAVAAIAAVSALGFSLEEIAVIARNLHSVVGRCEVIKVALPRQSAGQGDNNGFTIIIDYAHEPKSLEAIYKAAKLFLRDPSPSRGSGSGRPGCGRLVCLLGAQGGGRDKWKRPEMGKIAARYCDEIVLTNEDPYDEPPLEIIEGVERGILEDSRLKIKDSRIYKIVDRKEAIKKAISLAKPGDVVV
ncbi:MAG: UDP-N-acetylmuramyl-tripeptide synthetase, partial [bacterium]|nr:UDP-N-acetylmuramyl-tripeptide synthetase [bacterium]